MQRTRFSDPETAFIQQIDALIFPIQHDIYPWTHGKNLAPRSGTAPATTTPAIRRRIGTNAALARGIGRDVHGSFVTAD